MKRVFVFAIINLVKRWQHRRSNQLFSYMLKLITVFICFIVEYRFWAIVAGRKGSTANYCQQE